MDIHSILATVDHTLLKPEATESEIAEICRDALAYSTASVCIPASFVSFAAGLLQGKIPICTVIGFPTGYTTTAAKCFETTDAVANGADEIDMVINIGWLKDKQYDRIRDEINAVKSACSGRILKVIIETCLLTDEEKIKMCEIVSESDADYIKTSTGFSSGGATVADIALFKAHLSPEKKIKAAGGISSIEDAEAMIAAGASRLGTSRIIKLVKEI